MDLYRDIIIDHYKHPRNFGTLDKPGKTAEKYNATCGDRIRFDLDIDPSGNISEVKFSGVGCAISQSAASMLSEEIIGKTIEEVRMIPASHMTDLIGTPLTPSRVKCATLSLEVVHTALVK
jgi:nitrogen fixation protein NifU and related proteins